MLDLAPLIMRTIRREARKRRGSELSIPQFRALLFLARHQDASLSAVAEHIGITLPSASKIVDGLVRHGLATRRIAPSDHRHVALRLTPRGSARFRAVRRNTRNYLAGIMGSLSAPDRTAVVQAMNVLRSVFNEESA